MSVFDIYSCLELVFITNKKFIQFFLYIDHYKLEKR